MRALIFFLLCANAGACVLESGVCKNEDYENNNEVCEKIKCSDPICHKVVQTRTYLLGVPYSWSNEAVIDTCDNKCGISSLYYYYDRYKDADGVKRSHARSKRYYDCKLCRPHNSSNPSCGTKGKPYRCVSQAKTGYICGCEQSYNFYGTDSQCNQSLSLWAMWLFIILGIFLFLGILYQIDRIKRRSASKGPFGQGK